MSETEVNIPLLRKAVEWAEAEAAKPPELCEWEQRSYRWLPSPRRVEKAPGCGTCFCVAGYVTALIRPGYDSGDVCDDPAKVAAEELGIDRDVASVPGGLFWDENTIEDVRRIAEELAGERL